MKKTHLIFQLVLAYGLVSCNLGASTDNTRQPDVSTVVAETLEADAVLDPNHVIYNNITLTIPQGVATNALTGTTPAITDEQQLGPWGIAPQHVKIVLDNYSGLSTFHEAAIRIYPAAEFSAISSQVSENIRKLQGLIDGSLPLAKENMPSIPFFNAGQVITSQAKVFSFSNGAGVRLITQYDNGIVPVNKEELFYHFQGLTSDGKYYIIAVLPSTPDFLPYDTVQYTIDAPTALDFPPYYNANATVDDLTAYFNAVTDKLNSLTEQDFRPALSTLDELIQSITINP